MSMSLRMLYKKKKLVFESCISLCHLRLYKINVSFYFHKNILIVAAVVVLGVPCLQLDVTSHLPGIK